MIRDWESTFSTWASPPSEAEQVRIENAIRAVRDALDADVEIKDYTRVFVHGSYRNRVNVRQDSDVDLGVLYTGETFGVHYPTGMSDSDFGNCDTTYHYGDFKDDVEQALLDHFGPSSVHRSNKTLEIRENSYRVDADVTPFIIHRRYYRVGGYICGVQLNPDNGGKLVNWPERLYDEPHWPNQHYENAVSKNSATSRGYKGIVRILKKLRNEMEDGAIQSARAITGFELECMVWNVPDTNFEHDTWDGDVQAVLSHLWSNTQDDGKCHDWAEVSDLKYLFRGTTHSRQAAHEFLDTAWSYVGVR